MDLKYENNIFPLIRKKLENMKYYSLADVTLFLYFIYNIIFLSDNRFIKPFIRKINVSQDASYDILDAAFLNIFQKLV